MKIEYSSVRNTYSTGVRGVQMKLSELSKAIGLGTVENDSDFCSLGKLNALSSEKSLIFLSEDEYIPKIDKSLVSAVITTNEISSALRNSSLGILVSDNPKRDFYIAHNYLIQSGFYFDRFDTVIDETAIIHSTANIASRNVRIGKNTIIYPNATILENSIIGDNCVVMTGTVVGSEGYEVIEIDGINRIVSHAGWSIIKNNVQIETNTVVCKGLFPTRNTIIEEEVTIDNLVHVAHGVQIGRRSKIVAHAVLSGNITIGENVWIGPSAVITNGIIIGDNAKVSLGAVVIRNVPSGCTVSGNFAIEHEEFMRLMSASRRSLKS